MVTRQEAYDEIVLDLRSTGKYQPGFEHGVRERIWSLGPEELERFMLLYRHNRVTIKP